MEILGISIFICTILYIDYKEYIRCSENTLFFKDSTQVEKDLRKIQRLEIKLKLKELKDKDI